MDMGPATRDKQQRFRKTEVVLTIALLLEMPKDREKIRTKDLFGFVSVVCVAGGQAVSNLAACWRSLR